MTGDRLGESQAARLPGSGSGQGHVPGQDDKCPDQAEVWNGIDDADGCADEAPKGKPAKALISVQQSKTRGTEIRVEQPLKVGAKGEIEPASLLTLRALSSELLAHPAWSVTVGVRAAPKGGDAEAQARAAAIVAEIRRFTRRETAAAVAGWDSVKGAPRAAETGIGILLNSGDAAPVAAAENKDPVCAQGAAPAKVAAPAKAPAPAKAAAPPKAPAPAKAPAPKAPAPTRAPKKP